MFLHRGRSRVLYSRIQKNSVIGENHGEKGYVIGEILS